MPVVLCLCSNETAPAAELEGPHLLAMDSKMRPDMLALLLARAGPSEESPHAEEHHRETDEEHDWEYQPQQSER